MFKARLLLAAMIPFAYLTAQAQETVLVQKRQAVVTEDSSEHNRMGKKFVVEGQILGIGIGGATTQGVVVGYHLDRNTVGQLEVSSGVRKNSDSLFDNIETKVTTIGVHAKKFLANSFYVKGGVDYSTVKYDNDYIWTTSANKDAYGFEASMISAALVIGNQWQWENFTLGCDWIGLTMPISQTISSEYADESSDLAAKYNKEDQQTLLKDTTAQALRFYVGYTF
jgi:hypothetical protein